MRLDRLWSVTLMVVGVCDCVVFCGEAQRREIRRSKRRKKEKKKKKAKKRERPKGEEAGSRVTIRL